MLLLRLRSAEKDFLRANSNVDDLAGSGIAGSGGGGGNAVTLTSPQDLGDAAAVAVRGRRGGG
jgi:hypothetical protein